jgi:hypothetical protein
MSLIIFIRDTFLHYSGVDLIRNHPERTSKFLARRQDLFMLKFYFCFSAGDGRRGREQALRIGYITEAEIRRSGCDAFYELSVYLIISYSCILTDKRIKIVSSIISFFLLPNSRFRLSGLFGVQNSSDIMNLPLHKATRGFTASIASAYRLSTSKITLSDMNNDIHGLDCLLKQKQGLRKLWHETKDPACKAAVNWVVKYIRRLTRRKALERWENKIGNCEVTPQAIWPIAKSLMERDGPRAPTAIHGSPGLKFHPLEKANAIADCLENQFAPHDLCDYNHERRVEARVHALLETVDISPPERVRPCDLQKLINSLKLRNACGIDGIPNECLRHLPRRPLVYLTHLFNNCIRLSHFSNSWEEAEVITLPKPGKDPKFPQNLRPISLLSTTGKLFEKVLKIVQRHTEERGLHNACQFGFRAHHSTTLQCMRLTDLVTLNFNNNMSTPAVFLDIEKAFDTTWHPGLLYKLSKIKFSVNLIKLISSFLSQRKFRVSVEGEMSSPREMQAGVHKVTSCPPYCIIFISMIPPKHLESCPFC